MNKNIKKISFLTIAIIMIFTIFNLSSVMAASTTLTATTSKTVESGGTFKVTISSSVKLTGWTIAIANNGGCTFSTATGGELTGTTIFGTALDGTTTLATYTFKAPTVTKDTKYTISFSGTEMCDIDTNEVSAANKPSVTITVKAEEVKKDPTPSTTTPDTNTDKKEETTTVPKEKSNNAFLKTLGVRISDSLAKELGVKTDEYDFSGFSKNKTSYSVTVPKNVDSLKVFATAGENGTVKISGSSGFEVGSNNKITIKVTSENGKTTKTYTIKVTQLAEEEEKPGNLIEDGTELYLTNLKIDGIELFPQFSKDVYSYTATLDDANVSEVKVDAKANVEKAKIDISGNTELVEGENTINILVTLEDSTEQAVYQVIVTKATSETVITDIEADTPSSTTDLIGSIKNYIVIAIAVILLIILAVIVLVILLRRENKNTEEDEDYIEDEKEIKAEEYNVYNNDDNEFADNEIEKDNFIESLYKQRNGNTYNEEELTEDDKETIEEINKQTEKIFEEKVEGQSVAYNSNEIYEENPLEVRKRRRGKGKHSL